MFDSELRVAELSTLAHHLPLQPRNRQREAQALAPPPRISDRDDTPQGVSICTRLLVKQVNREAQALAPPPRISDRDDTPQGVRLLVKQTDH